MNRISAPPAATTPASAATAATAGRGFTAAISAFGIWGLFPLYLIGLRHVSAMQITAHRIVWSLVFVLGWLAVIGDLGKLREAAMRKGVLVRLVGSAFFIAVNWIGFAWAVNNGHVLEVSLAYFIGPLINVMLGIFVLSERLNRAQWLAVAFAAAGVAFLTFVAGRTPWIALMVGSSFAFYGLIRKTVSVDALPGLAIETILLTPFAAGYLIWCEMQGIARSGTPVRWSTGCCSRAAWSRRCRWCCSPSARARCPIPPSASCSSSRPACSWCAGWWCSAKRWKPRAHPVSC